MHDVVWPRYLLDMKIHVCCRAYFAAAGRPEVLMVVFLEAVRAVVRIGAFNSTSMP